MRESVVEKYLREQMEERGAMCEKHTSPGRRGVPDRLGSWAPGRGEGYGQMDAIETKAPGKKPRDEQDRDHKRRAKLGIPVYLIDTKDKVDLYVRARMNGREPICLWSVPIG